MPPIVDPPWCPVNLTPVRFRAILRPQSIVNNVDQDEYAFTRGYREPEQVEAGAHADAEWTWELLGRTIVLVAQAGVATVIKAEAMVVYLCP
jgi:hypothetical protein